MLECLQSVRGQCPHPTLMWLDLMKAPCIERESLVMDVVPGSLQVLQLVFHPELGWRIARSIFHPDSTSGKASQGDDVIRVSDHISYVPMQPHLGIAEDGNAGPAFARKPFMQKAIYRLAYFFIVRHPRDAHDASVTVEAESAVFLICSWPDCPDSALMLPSPGPCVQQLDEILLGSRFCHSSNPCLKLGCHRCFLSRRHKLQCHRTGSIKLPEDPLALSSALGRRVEIPQLPRRLRRPRSRQPLDRLPAVLGTGRACFKRASIPQVPSPPRTWARSSSWRLAAP